MSFISLTLSYPSVFVSCNETVRGESEMMTRSISVSDSRLVSLSLIFCSPFFFLFDKTRADFVQSTLCTPLDHRRGTFWGQTLTNRQEKSVSHVSRFVSLSSGEEMRDKESPFSSVPISILSIWQDQPFSRQILSSISFFFSADQTSFGEIGRTHIVEVICRNIFQIIMKCFIISFNSTLISCVIYPSFFVGTLYEMYHSLTSW